MRRRDLHGDWVVIGYEGGRQSYNYAPDCLCDIRGAEFQIDKDGDIFWKPHSHKNKLPYMMSEHFTLTFDRESWYLNLYLKNGQAMKFAVVLNGDSMTLNFSDFFLLHCRKREIQTETGSQFSLADAMNSEEFSDMVILAKNGKNFRCHKCILSCVIPHNNNILSCKRPEIIEAVLHYVYCGVLPTNLTRERAEKMYKFAKKNNITLLCETLLEFLSVSKVANEILAIIDSIKCCLENICKLIENTLSSSSQSIFAEPGKFLYLSKQISMELSIGAVRVLLFCDVYVDKKKSLSKQQRNDIFTKIAEMAVFYARRLRDTLPNFEQSYEAASPKDLSDLAQYLLPEITSVVQLGKQCVSDAVITMQKIVADAEKSDERNRKKQKSQRTMWKWKNMANISELVQLKSVQDEVTSVVGSITRLHEELGFATDSEKQQKFVGMLETLMDEPRDCSKLLQKVIDNGQRKKSKIFMKLSVPVLAWFIEKLKAQKSSIQSVIKVASSMISSELFDETIKELGLITNSSSAAGNLSCPSSTAGPAEESEQTSEALHDSEVSPPPRNPFAERLQKLLESETLADMEFFVSDEKLKSGPTVFKAHRVVVATRCKWFSRALSSGMKESIERKFHIEDCSPDIFKCFLQYLYGGSVDDYKDLSEENLADLLTLADRYEVSDLMRICENLLSMKLEKKNVFVILSLADHIGARALKENALAYIERHFSSVTETEDFSKLSESLQATVSAIMETRLVFDPRVKKCSLDDGSSSNSSIDSSNEGQSRSDSSSSDDSDVAPFLDSSSLTACIASLREMLGPDAPESALKHAAITADCNVNRAINFYFEQC